jgi:antitoxin HicB
VIYSTFRRFDMKDIVKIPLILTPQPEGGFTVTSPLLPELLTEGDTLKEALSNVSDAIRAVIETYEDLGREFPANLEQDSTKAPIYFEHLALTQ